MPTAKPCWVVQFPNQCSSPPGHEPTRSTNCSVAVAAAPERAIPVTSGRGANPPMAAISAARPSGMATVRGAMPDKSALHLRHLVRVDRAGPLVRLYRQGEDQREHDHAHHHVGE